MSTKEEQIQQAVAQEAQELKQGEATLQQTSGEQQPIDILRASLSLRGRILLPSSGEEYDKERTTFAWNFMGHPSLIIVCASTKDVQAAVKYCCTVNVDFTVAGGKHSAYAVMDGKVMISLSNMRNVYVDPKQQIALVQGGARNGDVDHECSVYGLHTTLGNNMNTGIGGLASGAGHGYLARRYGLTIDNVIGLELVTAGGEIVQVGEDSTDPRHVDLFWACRGSAFNFGIVTWFKLKLHPIGHQPKSNADPIPQNMVVSGLMVYPLRAVQQIRPIAENYVNDENRWSRDSMFWYIFARNPMDNCTTPVVLLQPSSLKLDIAESLKEVNGLKALLPPPLMDAIQPMPYLKLQSIHEQLQAPGYWLMRGSWIGEFNEEVEQLVLDAIEKQTPAQSHCLLVLAQTSGAVHDTPIDGTSFPHRKAMYWYDVVGIATKPEDVPACDEWTNMVRKAIQPYSHGSYINAIDLNKTPDEAAAFASNLQRLKRVKAMWDKDNIFHNNRNVEPATASEMRDKNGETITSYFGVEGTESALRATKLT